MNEIRVNRLFFTGLVTLVVFIVVEFLVETFFETVVFRYGVSFWYLRVGVQHWGWKNQLVNILIALLNTNMLV
jgi:hypothetical protein